MADKIPDSCPRCGRDGLHLPDEGNYCCCPQRHGHALYTPAEPSDIEEARAIASYRDDHDPAAVDEPSTCTHCGVYPSEPCPAEPHECPQRKPSAGTSRWTQADAEEWGERHTVNLHGGDLFCAFEDAATMHLTRDRVEPSAGALPEAIAWLTDYVRRPSPGEAHLPYLRTLLAAVQARVPQESAEPSAEAFIQAAISKSPEPLRELGRHLADWLDEDRFATAERLLLALAARSSQPPAIPADRAGLVNNVLRCAQAYRTAPDANAPTRYEELGQALDALAATPAAPAAGWLFERTQDSVRVTAPDGKVHTVTPSQLPASARALLERMTAALAAPAIPEDVKRDAERLDHLQKGLTVEILLGATPKHWRFRVGGLRSAVGDTLREAIDAAMAADKAQPQGDSNG